MPLSKPNARVAILRVEQLYPFPEKELAAQLALYPAAAQLVWVQEEPFNMGGRKFIVPQLRKMVAQGVSVGEIARPERASPAEGYPAAHAAEQARIVKMALD